MVSTRRKWSPLREPGVEGAGLRPLKMGVLGRTRSMKRGKVQEYRQWMLKRLGCPGHGGKAGVARAE